MLSILVCSLLELNSPALELKSSALAWAPEINSKIREEAQQKLLDGLQSRIVSGKVNYHFNDSAHGVLYANAGLAFLANGSTLSSGPHKAGLKACYQQIERIMGDNSFSLQPVWGCAQSTVFLAELHRLGSGSQKGQVKSLMEKYCLKLSQSQTVRGSWCHGFEDKKNELGYDDLIATSVMAMQGLGMARREGVKIDQKTVDKAMKYLADSVSDGGWGGRGAPKGGIGYSPRSNQKNLHGPGRTAMGLLALLALNQKKSSIYGAASKYVKASLPDGGTSKKMESLNTGHGCASLGLLAAAWWSAENGSYDEFWRGQGATILARRQSDGSFSPAPSDAQGNPQSQADGGDFSNALHALIFALSSRRLSCGPAVAGNPLLAAVESANEVLEGWQGTPPDSLKALAAANSGSPAKTPAQIGSLLNSTVRDLSKSFSDPQHGAAILKILGAEITPVAKYNDKSQRVQIDLIFPPLRSPGLLKGSLRLGGENPWLLTPLPTRPLSPGKSQILLAVKPGKHPDGSLPLEIEWDIGGQKHLQALPTPLSL
ncbi:MAG: hypothetical protein RL095_3942 [Verrucomicrobiota bacterium]|jgi:hypothetical protein